jgi:ketosteroid isomerase-like protein
MDRILPEQIQQHVLKFWRTLNGESPGGTEGMYSPTATVFTGKARHSEPASLVVVRRTRQSASRTRGSHVEVGSIELQIVGNSVAIASYTYQMHASALKGEGRQVQFNTFPGRATQIFHLDAAAVPRVVHEHLSAAGPSTVEVVKSGATGQRSYSRASAVLGTTVTLQSSPNGTEPISPAQVRAQVRHFWTLFTDKSKAKFEELYLPEATVFALDGRRCEPARLMIVRRSRELFATSSFTEAQAGSVDVQVLQPDLAVASYPFHLSGTRTLPGGRRYIGDVPFGRATQVFLRDKAGALLIVHEHTSSAEPVVVKELARDSARGVLGPEVR